MASRSPDQSWPPAGVPPRLTDPLLRASVKEPGRARGTTGTISRPHQRASLSRQSVGIPMPPAVRRRRGDAHRGRGLPERRPPLDPLAQRQAPRGSELRSTVNLHPGPPRVVSSRRPTAWEEARMPPQPFTTYVGTSASSRARRATGCGRPLPRARPSAGWEGPRVRANSSAAPRPWRSPTAARGA